RYRALNDDDVSTADDPLRFDAPDNAFDTLGTLAAGADQLVQPNDFVVIHNLGIPGADAYEAGATNIARVQAFGAGAIAGEDHIAFVGTNQFPLESPGRRFFVTSGP